MFKSEVKKITDFRTIDSFIFSDQIVEIQNEIIQSLSTITNKYSGYKKVDDFVKKGDLVTLDLKSTSEKYNKIDLPVVVGAGLFNKEFEEELINKVLNEINLITLNGVTIETSITKIERKVVPKLTDELVKNEGIDGVLTVDDYKEYLFNTIVEDKTSKITNDIIKKVIERSEFKIVEDDINRLFEGDLSKMRFLAKEEGMVLEEMTEVEIGQRIGVPSLEKFEEIYKNDRYPYLIKHALLGLSIAAEANVTFNEKTYEEELQLSEDYRNHSLSVTKQISPYFNYLVNRYSTYAFGSIKSFLKESFHQSDALIQMEG